jgi:hypothetical protein
MSGFRIPTADFIYVSTAGKSDGLTPTMTTSVELTTSILEGWGMMDSRSTRELSGDLKMSFAMIFEDLNPCIINPLMMADDIFPQPMNPIFLSAADIKWRINQK